MGLLDDFNQSYDKLKLALKRSQVNFPDKYEITEFIGMRLLTTYTTQLEK